MLVMSQTFYCCGPCSLVTVGGWSWVTWPQQKLVCLPRIQLWLLHFQRNPQTELPGITLGHFLNVLMWHYYIMGIVLQNLMFCSSVLGSPSGINSLHYNPIKHKGTEDQYDAVTWRQPHPRTVYDSAWRTQNITGKFHEFTKKNFPRRILDAIWRAPDASRSSHDASSPLRRSQCPIPEYCLNGGTCHYYSTIGEQSCQ